jgi:hypothetical protein
VLVVGMLLLLLLLLLQAVSVARPMRPVAAAAVAKRLRFIVCYPISIDDTAPAGDLRRQRCRSEAHSSY